MMVAIQLNAYVDENGEIRVYVPADFPRGEVTITIEQLPAVDEDEPPLTEEEIQALLHPVPKTGAEIVEMLKTMKGWEDYGIEDPVEWLADSVRETITTHFKS